MESQDRREALGQFVLNLKIGNGQRVRAIYGKQPDVEWLFRLQMELGRVSSPGAALNLLEHYTRKLGPPISFAVIRDLTPPSSAAA